MKQVSAFTRLEEGMDEYWVRFECGCCFKVVPEMYFEKDLPCVLHEEQRYLQEYDCGL